MAGAGLGTQWPPSGRGCCLHSIAHSSRHQLCRRTGSRHHWLIHIATLLLVFLSQPARAFEDPGAVLFHADDNALSWDHDELVLARQLHMPNFKDLEGFLVQQTVADVFGLRPIQAMHMPVPVNLVFVGFAADGNLHVNISAADMQEWFGHLDHVLPHTRLELSELTCAEDGHCTGSANGFVEPPPVSSYVHLNFSCNLVVTQRIAVARTFERAIHAFSRPVDPQIEMGAQQVDVTRMESFVNNFLAHLNILERGYTIIVMNPTWSVTEPIYGYRQGMSSAEMDLLLLEVEQVKRVMNQHNNLREPEPPHTPSNGWWARPGRSEITKFGAQDLSWNSDNWLREMDHYLTQVEDYRKQMLRAVGDIKGAAAVAHAINIMFSRTHSPLAAVLREELMFPDPYTSVYSKFRTMHPAEDCMVGNWVSGKRWMMMDLTAGSFDWGPALGGQGVVHKHSIPSIVDHFTAYKEAKEKYIEGTKSEHDKHLDMEIESRVHHAKSERANRAYQAFAYEMQLKKQQAGSPDSPQRVETQEQAEEEGRLWKNKYNEAVLKAELDIYTEYSAQYCEHVARPMPICQKMKEASLAARNMLAKLAGAQATSVDVWRDVSWNVFRSELNLDDHDPDISDAAARGRDLFLSELNNVLSRALRHVVTPPTAAWSHVGGDKLRNTATPFATQVMFQIYIIREPAHVADAAVVQDARPFDVEAFKQEVTSLALGTQRFNFHTHTVQLHDDPVLATAMAAAQRTSAQEIPADTATVQDNERVYLDSRVLAHVLRQRFRTAHEHSQQPASHFAAERQARISELNGYHAVHEREGASSHRLHEVPVFVFEMHRHYAVLLDEHYNAKVSFVSGTAITEALEDMVLVVQNAARDDEHPTGMMCGGALLARPLSPLRDALSAVLMHLGGVLPPHLGYNTATRKVMHDWLWSVGSHPLSATSPGTHFTDTQRDALARAYLLDGIDSSVEAINLGVRTLSRIRPTKLVHKHLKENKADIEKLLSLWPVLIEHYRLIMTNAWQLDWGPATGQLAAIEDMSLQFLHACQRLAEVPLGGHCVGLITPTTEHLVFPTIMISVATAAAALLYLLWPLLGMARGKDSSRYRVRY